MHKPGTHQSDVEKHGDVAMGFPNDKTAHHFRLTQEGGAIEVTVREAGDMQNLDAIRMHLKHRHDVCSRQLFDSDVCPQSNATRRSGDAGSPL
jgi:hypothetical protein